MAHAHAQHDHRAPDRRRLGFALVLTGSYMVTEVIGGLVTGSLALLADAGHMLSDVAALGLALFAFWVVRRPPTPKATYGYHRTEILAALANGAALVAISVYVLIEALQRFSSPPEVRGGLMLAIAAGGLLVNLVVLAILHGGDRDSLNMRGAFLHVLSDALGSVGAMVSGALILAFDWRWADPAASVLIALLVMWSAWALLKASLAVLMERAPADVDVEDVRHAIAGERGVVAVHDLHVWTITSRKLCLSAHVVTARGTEAQRTLRALTALVRERFGIEHLTIQIEDEGFAQRQCHACEPIC